MPVSLFFVSETSFSCVVKSNWALIQSRGLYSQLSTAPTARIVSKGAKRTAPRISKLDDTPEKQVYALQSDFLSFTKRY